MFGPGMHKKIKKCISKWDSGRWNLPERGGPFPKGRDEDFQADKPGRTFSPIDLEKHRENA